MTRRTLGALVLAMVWVVGTQAQTTRSQSPAKVPAAKNQAPAGPDSEQQTTALNLSAYAELLRSDVRAQKVAILTEVVGFTAAEDAAFWPIYREYEFEMSKLNDERVALIQEYAKTYTQMTDATADALATKALDLESRRQDTKRRYYGRFKQALSAVTAARFLQVEQQIQLLVDLQISAALPIVK